MVLEFTIMLCIIISVIFSLIAQGASNSLICYGTFVKNLKFTMQLANHSCHFPLGHEPRNWIDNVLPLTAMRYNIWLNRMRWQVHFVFDKGTMKTATCTRRDRSLVFARCVYAKGGNLHSLNQWNLGHSAVAVQMSSHVTVEWWVKTIKDMLLLLSVSGID